MKTRSKFHIGQRVTFPSFVDAGGKPVPEMTGLVVTDIEKIKPRTMKPWYRVTARQPNEGGQCAGHERFFVPAEQQPRKELVTG